MTTTLVLQTCLAQKLMSAAKEDLERAGVILAKAVTTPNGSLRLLAKEIIWVPDCAYLERSVDSLLITSYGFVPSLQFAETSGCVAIWMHTHPGDGSSPTPSRHDQLVDKQLAALFQSRSGSPYYASLIVAHDGGRLTFSGHVESDGVDWAIDRVWVVGSHFSFFQSALTARSYSHIERFERNVRAFGGPVQQILGELHIGVVGCGGTGSAVVEQLVRLGVNTLTLVDPDSLTSSNITRVYGSTIADVGSKKVSVLEQHCRRINPGLRIHAIASMVTQEATARELLNADLIFGCTDDNAGRLVLARLATYFLIPTIDCGVLLESDPEVSLRGIHGRVTVLHPGAACLVCRNRIDLARARTEGLTPGERVRLQHEGYAPALGTTEPAVVVFTTMVASLAVSELLERLVHYGAPIVPNEILLRLHDRELSTNVASPRSRHYCHPDSGKLGIGHTNPFLDMTWSN